MEINHTQCLISAAVQQLLV